MQHGRPFVGREDELCRLGDAVAGRSNTSLWLIVGEAGIGKSALLRAVIDGADPRVLIGSCLPLTHSLPLLPLTDILRAAFQLDGGRSLATALAHCPAFVTDVLARLVPESAADPTTPSPSGNDAWWGLHVFSAVRLALNALAVAPRSVFVIEDLHWADSLTLDLMDYLLAPGHRLDAPIVATYRSDDPATHPNNVDWFARALRTAEVISLDPLSLSETAKQIELLQGRPTDPATVEAVFRRSEGNALFTEQLVNHPRDASPTQLPESLDELLNVRLRRLNTHARHIAGVLALVRRPLTSAQLCQLTNCTPDEEAEAVRSLRAAHMLRPSGDRGFELRHALLGEAIHADLSPGELASIHRAVAKALGIWFTSGVAAEIAEHFSMAAEHADELRWRVLAAREAQSLFASAHAASQWLRVIDLWDRVPEPEQVAGVPLAAVYGEADNALRRSGSGVQAAKLAEQAVVRLADVPDPLIKAGLFLRVAHARGIESPAAGLAALEKAISLYEASGGGAGYLRAVQGYAVMLISVGRFEAARRATSLGLKAADRVEHMPALRWLTAIQAWLDMAFGEAESATRGIERAWAMKPDSPDPASDIGIADWYTEVLLHLGELDQAAAIGRRVQYLIDEFQLPESHTASCVRSTVAAMLIERGQTSTAREFIDPVTSGPPTRDSWAVHLRRASLDTMSGELDDAQQRLTQVDGLQGAHLEFQIDVAVGLSEVALWRNDPAVALRRCIDTASIAAPTDASLFAGPLLVLAARAAADRAEQGGRTSSRTTARQTLQQLQALRAEMTVDPLAGRAVPATSAANTATWDAERRRISDDPTIETWARAARAWESLGRPHRVGYCLWRQAETALRQPNSRAEAAPLLRAAAQQASAHAPLLDAIRALARRARVDVAEQGSHDPLATTTPTPFNLTDREMAVLRLVGQGLSNKDIGANLFISSKTASAHVTHILRKLGVTSRTHAATVATRAGLID